MRHKKLIILCTHAVTLAIDRLTVDLLMDTAICEFYQRVLGLVSQAIFCFIMIFIESN